MAVTDDLVAQVMARAGIVSAARRREVERELRGHVEDVATELRAVGCSEDEVISRLRDRFGEPSDVAEAFADVYKGYRVAAYAAFRSAQLAASFAAVALVISSVQLVVALSDHVVVASAFSKIRVELFGFAALACGYVASSFADAHLERQSVTKRAALSIALALVLGAGLTAIVPGHVLVPAVACGCAVIVRFLERSHVRFAPLIGAAGPMVLAWAFVGPVVTGNGRVPTTVAPFIVILDVAMACQVMSWVAALVERRMMLSPRATSTEVGS
ncbi:MAG TPA: hypothetical protein VF785_07515 [Gemmatimonadaceae bacterium]